MSCSRSAPISGCRRIDRQSASSSSPPRSITRSDSANLPMSCSSPAVCASSCSSLDLPICLARSRENARPPRNGATRASHARSSVRIRLDEHAPREVRVLPRALAGDVDQPRHVREHEHVQEHEDQRAQPELRVDLGDHRDDCDVHGDRDDELAHRPQPLARSGCPSRIANSGWAMTKFAAMIATAAPRGAARIRHPVGAVERLDHDRDDAVGVAEPAMLMRKRPPAVALDDPRRRRTRPQGLGTRHGIEETDRENAGNEGRRHHDLPRVAPSPAAPL